MDPVEFMKRVVSSQEAQHLVDAPKMHGIELFESYNDNQVAEDDYEQHGIDEDVEMAQADHYNDQYAEAL